MTSRGTCGISDRDGSRSATNDPWAGAARDDQLEILRATDYTFRACIAETWRDRRILIAGDAAHSTPPFIGQGMCAGVRDAMNLAWTLDAVIDGHASATLLDSYQAERRPHAEALINLAVVLGRAMTGGGAAAAVARRATSDRGQARTRRRHQGPRRHLTSTRGAAGRQAAGRQGPRHAAAIDAHRPRRRPRRPAPGAWILLPGDHRDRPSGPGRQAAADPGVHRSRPAGRGRAPARGMARRGQRLLDAHPPRPHGVRRRPV
ncbi:FAD-dependent monooxygenase [Actinoplanes hulinensis]|uniref:FAD-dependent monooxygenase n=1 Tax=Actinoplanes hulinensis TaxID=1144547 RepID=A0ABS7B2T9_9ACTN|nr:FAD-dependent monooxygenase [Actinoplanes hulinensis]